MRLLSVFAFLSLFALSVTRSTGQDTIQRISDTSVQQIWKSHYGFTMLVPNAARFNKLGSVLNQAGQSEVTNFILPGGCGSVTLRYYAEGRMIPKGFNYISDSIHIYDTDSAGRNGMIYRRLFLMTDFTVEAEVLLTQKGEAMYKPLLRSIFDSFVAPAGAQAAVPQWRYGRDPREFEQGRSPEYHLRQK